MIRRFVKNNNGFAMSWAVITVVIMCILAIGVVFAASGLLLKSAVKYNWEQAYLSARSAGLAVSSAVEGLESSSQSFSSELIPKTTGSVAYIKSFIYDDAPLGILSGGSLNIKRTAEDTIVISSTAHYNEESVTVLITMKLKSDSEPVEDTTGFAGVYAKERISIDNNASSVINGDVFSEGRSDLHIPGQASLTINGNLYYGGNVSSLNGLSKNRLTVNGAIIGSEFQYPDISGGWFNPSGEDFYDIKKLSETITNQRVRKFVPSVNSTNPALRLTISGSEPCYIVIPQGMTINLELIRSETGPVDVCIVLDGAHNALSASNTTMVDAFSSGDTTLRLYSVSPSINAFIYGADNSVVEIEGELEMTGAVHVDELRINQSFSCTYKEPTTLGGTSGSPTSYYWAVDGIDIAREAAS